MMQADKRGNRNPSSPGGARDPEPPIERNARARATSQASAVKQAMARENVRVGAGHAPTTTEMKHGLRGPGYIATVVVIVLLVGVAAWVALA